MKQAIGLKVKTQVKAGLISGGDFNTGNCKCINGYRWCTMANGSLHNMGPCLGV